MNFEGGSTRTLGNMKRAVPKVQMPPMLAIAVHAAMKGVSKAVHDRAPRAIRRLLPDKKPRTKQAALKQATVVKPAIPRRVATGLVFVAATGFVGITGAAIGVAGFAATAGAAATDVPADLASRIFASISAGVIFGPGAPAGDLGAGLEAGAGVSTEAASTAGLAPPPRIAAIMSLVEVGFGPGVVTGLAGAVIAEAGDSAGAGVAAAGGSPAVDAAAAAF